MSMVSLKDEQARRVHEKLRRELGTQICDWLSDPEVTEIMLNPDGSLWVEKLGIGMTKAGEMAAHQAEAMMNTVAATLKTVITREQPILECELPFWGARFEALIPPIVANPTFTMRRPALRIFTLDDYVRSGIMTEAQDYFVKKAIAERKNILVAGGTGTGKTTFLNAIIDHIWEVSPGHRGVIIEDTSEIQCKGENVVKLRAIDGIDMNRLLKVTMRLRPDRIIVGEVRGPECLTMLKAWGTGHPGGCCSVHANPSTDGTDAGTAAFTRIEALAAEAAVNIKPQLIAEAINVVVSIVKVPGMPGRKIDAIYSVKGHDGSKYILQEEK